MTLASIGSLTPGPQKPDATAATATATAATEEQRKAAREFEAIFLRQLLSSLEKSKGLGGQSSGGEVFRSMMVSALADTAAEGGGIGLSEVILKAMLPPMPAALAPGGGVRPDLSPGGPGQVDGPRPETIETPSLPSRSARLGAASPMSTEARPGQRLVGSRDGGGVDAVSLPNGNVR